MTRNGDRIIYGIALLYLTIPIGIFFAGWLKIGYALPLVGLLAWSVKRHLSAISFRQTIPKVTLLSGLGVALLLFLWLLFSGVGGFANQPWDHHFRNAVFRDLIHFDWPVYYSFGSHYKVHELAGHSVALNYYFTYWLPAALTGKGFGEAGGSLFLFGWSYLGLLLVFYYLNRLFGFRKTLLVSLVFIFWSGLDVLGQPLLSLKKPDLRFLEVYSFFFYTSFTTDLYNVFNQIIPTWLVTLMLLNFRKEVVWLPVITLVAYAPFPFVILFGFYLLYWVVRYYPGSGFAYSSVVSLIRRVFTWEGLMAFVAIVPCYFLYYKAHAAVPLKFFWNRFTSDAVFDARLIYKYGLTFFIGVGIYFLIIYLLNKELVRRRTFLFWGSLAGLFFIPLLSIGEFNDFASRGSIPLITLLCVFVISTLLRLVRERSMGVLALVAGVLLIASVTPVFSVYQGICLNQPPALKDSIGSFANPKVTKEKDIDNIYHSLVNFYSFEPQQYFFYKRLAK